LSQQSELLAIRAYCLERCKAKEADPERAVRDCENWKCSLWSYRFGGGLQESETGDMEAS